LQDGLTPAFIAAQQGHVAVIELLRDCGINLHAPTPFGTPYSIAAQVGNATMLELLRRS
jgi:hypothetical protein